MSYDIPFEIQDQIIKKLPVKSLIRFKSVSKQWISFIHSSELIPPQHRLLVSGREYSKEKHVSIVDDETFPLRKLSHTIPSSVNLLNIEAIFGSSQGLFCFYGFAQDRRMAVIWNPSIRKSVDIVVPSKLKWWMYHNVVGFSVCPRTFDPMLVNITYVKTVDTIAGYAPRQVEVFTLSSGAWKSLSINMPRESIVFMRNYNVELDGFIYWLAIDEGETGRYNMIMSFDMTSENFIEISLPDSLVGAHYSHLSISKRMESLVVLEPYSQRVYIVWMMEGGVQKSFTKLFAIEAPEASIRKVLGFRKSGEPIIAIGKINGSDEVYLYEPNSRHLSYIGIFGRYLRIASSYTNTTLLLDR